MIHTINIGINTTILSTVNEQIFGIINYAKELIGSHEKYIIVVHEVESYGSKLTWRCIISEFEKQLKLQHLETLQNPNTSTFVSKKYWE